MFARTVGALASYIHGFQTLHLTFKRQSLPRYKLVVNGSDFPWQKNQSIKKNEVLEVLDGLKVPGHLTSCSDPVWMPVLAFICAPSSKGIQKKSRSSQESTRSGCS